MKKDRLKLKKSEKMQKELDERERILKLRNILKYVDDNWSNSVLVKPEYEVCQQKKNIDFSGINLIKDKKLRNIFKNCLNFTRGHQLIKYLKEKNVDLNVFYRTKKKYNIPDFKFSNNRLNFENSIIEKYLVEKMSSENIAEECNFSQSGIIKILKKHDIKIRKEKNPLRYPPVNIKMSAEEFNQEISKRYRNKESVKDIAKKLNVNGETISKRLKLMGFEIMSRSFSNSKFVCEWCSNEQDAWIKSGIKSQRFCSSSCKNKAKDLRRCKRSNAGMQKMFLELKTIWGDQYREQIIKILNVNNKKNISIYDFLNNIKKEEYATSFLYEFPELIKPCNFN